MSENYIKDFLKQNGLSQYRLAKSTGHTLTTVNRWTKGYGMRAESALRVKKVYPDFDLSKINPELWG